jgi:MSHA biogenesis protein MshJ
MKARWEALEKRFAKLARRERLIVLAGGAAVILVLGFTLVEERFKQAAQLQKQVVQARADIAAARAQSADIVRRLAQDPDADTRGRIAELREQLEKLDREVKGVHRGLVPPERMAAVLEDMLNRNPRVGLVSLKTLPVTGLVEAKEETTAHNVYKHGIELTLRGSYLDLLDYLARLEKLPVQMFWARARMDASDYPRVRLTVTVYTLSLDRDWMVV